MIHLFVTPEARLVVDTYSGAIHIIDEVAYAALSLIQSLKLPVTEAQTWQTLETKLAGSFSPGEIQEALEEIQRLIADETLFTEDPYAGLALNLQKRKTWIKALCLNVAHTCNLDCDYCFASQGKYHGPRAIMSWEVAKQAIDFLIEASGKHRNLDIDFFGGEPLLNWGVVKKTVEYARSLEAKHNKCFRFTFTTNGMLLDESVGTFLNEQMKNVVLSLDGRKSVHDRLRHTVDGKGSYDRIVPRFQHFVSTRGDQEYYMRGTYTKNNLDFTKDVLHMANLGFDRLSMEPVIGDPDEPYMLGPADLEVLSDQYDQLATEMIRRNRLGAQARRQGLSEKDLPVEDRPFVFYHFMLNLESGPCIYKRIAGCGSGTEYLAVTPTGDLYPCHQFVGDEAYRVGNVFTGLTGTEIIGTFKSCNCYSHQACQNCWAKLYCSGGCTANALHASGSIQGVVPFSCDLFRKRMECAIRIQVAALLDQAAQNQADSQANREPQPEPELEPETPNRPSVVNG